MKQRNIRKRRALDEQEELSDGEGAAAGGEGQEGQVAAPPRLTADDVRLLQKQRQRRVGVNAAALMTADTRLPEKKAGPADAAAPDVLQAAFKRERRLQSEEEDPHMKQYVEEQLAKRMGRDLGQDEEARLAEGERQRRLQDPLLAALPEGLQKRQQDTELEPSWVTGILEVPLTLEQKLKNIEDTEAAKKQLLAAVDEDEEDGGEAAVLRRGQYPVSFGRQNPKHLKVIAETQAKKARMRVVQEDKRRKKKEEFAGW